MIDKLAKSASTLRGSRILLKITLLLVSMLTIMAAGIVAPSLPQIANEFGDTTNPQLLSKMVVALPPLFIAITAPLAGRFIDKRGRLRLLNFALVLYAIGGSSGLYLANIYLLLIGRAILGVAIGILMTTVLTLTGDYFEGSERQKFIGYQSAFIGLAGMLFLTAGGLLAVLHWRWPFITYLFSILLVPLTKRHLTEPRSHIKVDDQNINSMPLIVPVLWITGILLMILMYMVPIQVPFIIQQSELGSQIFIGIVLAIHALGIVISSLYYSKIKRVISFPVISFAAFFTMALGHYIIGTLLSSDGLIIGVFIAGIGFGQLISNTNLWVIHATHHKIRGKIIGILTSCYFMGQFFSPVLAETVIDHRNVASLFPVSVLPMLVIGMLFFGFRNQLSRAVM